jgi:hypothetical protein
VTYKLVGGLFTLSRPTGESFEAKLDGAVAPDQGNPGINGVSEKRISANAIEQADELDGKVVGVVRMRVAPDGKFMTVEFNDVVARTTTHFVAAKQSPLNPVIRVRSARRAGKAAPEY